jgi:hypothetical protein
MADRAALQWPTTPNRCCGAPLLEFATAKKRHEIRRRLEAYGAAVNFSVRSLRQVPGRLDKQTLARLPTERTRLQAIHKDQALRQA